MTASRTQSTAQGAALFRAGLVLLLLASANAFADHTELAPGEFEIISERFDGARDSTALNGNSELEDISADGRYVAFNTEAGVVNASSSNRKSLIYDRLTGETELFDPAPGAQTGSLMFSENGRIITFLSDSMDLGGAPVESGTQPNFDLFEYDRATNTTTRLTTGYNFEFRSNRQASLGSEDKYVLLKNGAGSDFLPDWYLHDKYTASTRRVLYESTSRAVIAGNGTAFAYYRFSRATNVWNLAWVSYSFAAQPVLIEADASLESVAISYDGTKLAYPNRLADGTQALYLYDVPTGTKTRLFENANGNLRRAAFSEDGLHLLIESTATNLTGTFDPNGAGVDLFDYNLQTGQVTRIAQVKPDGLSIYSANADASVIAFEDDSNFYDGDDANGGYSDVFVWSRQSGDVVRASNASRSYELIGGNNDSADAEISDSGQYVTFTSAATNLVAGDDNSLTDLFYYDRHTDELTNITQGANAGSGQGSMSADGQRVVFHSRASNLTDGDDAGSLDVLLYDNSTGQLTNLTPGNPSWTILGGNPPRISADGRWVLFNTFPFAKLLDINSGELRDLPFQSVSAFALSADAQQIVLKHPSAGSHSISVYDTTTGQTLNAIIAPDFFKLWSPEISDDGSLVVLYSTEDQNPGDTPNDSGGLYLWNWATDAKTFIAGEGERPYEAFDISADGSRVVFESTEALLPNVDPSGSGCAQQPSAYAYEVASGVITHVGCVPQEAPGEVRSTPSLSGNGDLMVAGIRGWYVDTDVNAFDNIYVQRLDGSPTGGNTAPVALDQSVTVNADGSIAIVLRGTDDDGDALTFALQNGPTNGALVGDAPNLEYTPTAGYVGTDSFTFTANDGQATSSAAIVSIQIVGGTSQTFSGTQRPGTRIIDLSATWPAEAAWTQVREFDGPSSVLWDGSALSWTGTYTVPPGVNEVRFNSRWWIGNEVRGNTDITVVLDDGEPTNGETVRGFAWIDSNANSNRDGNEPGEVGRRVDLYRCGPPWGIAGSAVTQAPNGDYNITGLDAGEYQIGTASAGVEFTSPGGDNVVYPTGFSNCVTVDGSQPPLGIGLLSADTPRVNITGFAWLDLDGDSRRAAPEPGDAGRTVTAYRCGEPWGVAGEAVTNASGDFEIAGVTPGVYQFGTSTENVTFSEVRRDNDVWETGFTRCIDFGAQPQAIGIGVLSQ